VIHVSVQHSSIRNVVENAGNVTTNVFKGLAICSNVHLFSGHTAHNHPSCGPTDRVGSRNLRIRGPGAGVDPDAAAEPHDRAGRDSGTRADSDSGEADSRSCGYPVHISEARRGEGPGRQQQPRTAGCAAFPWRRAVAACGAAGAGPSQAPPCA
jgi:hypothetical protein